MRDSVLPKSASSFPAAQQRRASHERWISLYPCYPCNLWIKGEGAPIWQHIARIANLPIPKPPGDILPAIALHRNLRRFLLLNR